MYCIDLQQESDRIYNLKKEEYIKGGGKNFIKIKSNHLDYPKLMNIMLLQMQMELNELYF